MEIDIEPEFLICGGFGIQGDPTLPTEAVIVEGRSGNGEAGMAGRQGAFRQVAVTAGIERKHGVRPESLEYGEIILVCPDQFIECTVPDGGIGTEISLLRVEDTLSGGPEVQGSEAQPKRVHPDFQGVVFPLRKGSFCAEAERKRKPAERASGKPGLG